MRNPGTETTTTQHRTSPTVGRDDVAPSKSDPLDFRNLYSYSKTRPGSSRSVTSFSTDVSSATDPASNTSRASLERKEQKRRFLTFMRVLMKFLERKNPPLFYEAQTLIAECQTKKASGEIGYESLTKSIRSPLKEVVGPRYWKQARWYMRNNATTTPPIEPLPATEDVPCFSISDSKLLEQTLSRSPLSTRPSRTQSEERRLRRDRFWILVRLLMKYLEKRDPGLYKRAKDGIKDCARRNRLQEDGYRSISEAIQRRLKEEVGIVYWRKAEKHLARVIIQRANAEDAKEAMLIESERADNDCVYDAQLPRHLSSVGFIQTHSQNPATMKVQPERIPKRNRSYGQVYRRRDDTTTTAQVLPTGGPSSSIGKQQLVAPSASKKRRIAHLPR